MYKNLFYLLTLLPLFSVAQINFEKGYFIDNSNQRVECFIKNLDWKNNPKDFDYKISENSEEIKTTIEKVKEFEI